MDMESTAQAKARYFASAWGRVKALPCKLMAKVTSIAKSVKKLGQDDPRRITHALKVGLALTLVSLLYYVRPLYAGFGVSGMWAVLTVVVVFEFTVGGTLSKCLNRGFATFLAGALGIGADYFACLFGKKGEPIVLGILVFSLAAVATFSRFFPRIKQRYDYGVLIFILTFSLVAVSGYRVDELVELAHQRISTIIMGGATCMLISIFISPVWAGEDLHKSVASNLEKLATYLEGFGGVYFGDDGSGVLSKDGKSSYSEGYKSVLNSKNSEESLANFARWEPGHGRFRLRHPWKNYLKIGALARQCAYQIEAINGCIHSDIQASQEFKSNIEGSCKRMSLECGEALKALSTAIKTMTDPTTANPHVESSKAAMKDLKFALKAASLESTADFLAIVPAATVASVLVEIVKSVEKISDAVHELSQLAHFNKAVEPTVSPEKLPQHLLHRGIIQPVLDADDGNDNVVITIHEISTDSPEPHHQVAKPGQRMGV